MSGVFPFFGGFASETIGANTASSQGTGATGGASANTKGSWSQISASTSIDADGFYISFSPWHSAYVEYAIDIAIGASGSEQIIVENLMLVSMASGGRTQRLFVPVRIPSGSRVAARSQASVGGLSPSITLQLVNFGANYPLAASKAISYGFNSSTTRGVEYLCNGAAVNTKGAWNQITSGTSEDHCGLLLYERNFSSVTDSGCLTDIGFGSAGSEVVVLANFQSYSETSDSFGNAYIHVPIHVPSGTRIAFRSQSSRSSSGNSIEMMAWGLS